MLHQNFGAECCPSNVHQVLFKFLLITTVINCCSLQSLLSNMHCLSPTRNNDLGMYFARNKLFSLLEGLKTLLGKKRAARSSQVLLFTLAVIKVYTITAHSANAFNYCISFSLTLFNSLKLLYSIINT